MRNIGEVSLIARRVEYDKSGQDFFINIIKTEVQRKKHGYIALFLEESDEELKYQNNLLGEDGSPYVTIHSNKL